MSETGTKRAGIGSNTQQQLSGRKYTPIYLRKQGGGGEEAGEAEADTKENSRKRHTILR